MSIHKPQNADSEDFASIFRYTARMAFFLALMGVQSDSHAYKDPCEDWDNMDFLEQDMRPYLPPEPLEPFIEDDTNDSWDFRCTEEPHKYG